MEQLNLYEILKYAPKGENGIRLYSKLFGESIIDENDFSRSEIRLKSLSKPERKNIKHHYNSDGTLMWATGDGIINSIECMVFPDKDSNNWDYWQFKLYRVGDYVYVKDLGGPCKVQHKFYDTIEINLLTKDNDILTLDTVELSDSRFASPDEIKLFEVHMEYFKSKESKNDEVNEKSDSEIASVRLPRASSTYHEIKSNEELRSLEDGLYLVDLSGIQSGYGHSRVIINTSDCPIQGVYNHQVGEGDVSIPLNIDFDNFIVGITRIQ